MIMIQMDIEDEEELKVKLKDLGISPEHLVRFDKMTGDKISLIKVQVEEQINRMKNLKLATFMDLYLLSVLDVDQRMMPQVKVFTAVSHDKFETNQISSLKQQLEEIIGMPDELRDEYLRGIKVKGSQNSITIEALEFHITFSESKHIMQVAKERWGFDTQLLGQRLSREVRPGDAIHSILYYAIGEKPPIQEKTVLKINYNNSLSEILAIHQIDINKTTNDIELKFTFIDEHDLIGRYRSKMDQLHAAGVHTIADLYLYLNLGYDIVKLRDIIKDDKSSISDIVFRLTSSNNFFSPTTIGSISHFDTRESATQKSLLGLLYDLADEAKVKAKIEEFGIQIDLLVENYDPDFKLIDRMRKDVLHNLEEVVLGYGFGIESMQYSNKSSVRGNEDSADYTLVYIGGEYDLYAGVFIVSDGMGGLMNARLTSNDVVNGYIKDANLNIPSIIQNISINKIDFNKISNNQFKLLDIEFRKYLKESVLRIHNAIRQTRERGGATLTVVIRIGNFVAEINVGDSPAYKLNRDERIELSEKDTPVARKNPEFERTRYYREIGTNILSQFIGDPDGIRNWHINIFVIVGESLVLCSDGLDQVINKDQLIDVVTNNTARKAASILLTRSMNTAKDDTTVIVIK